MTYALLAVATILWGANFNLSKHVLADEHALVAAAARFDIAAAVMLALCAVRRTPVPILRHGRAYAILGAVGVAGFNALFFYGMKWTSPVNGALIMATSPLLTATLAYFVSGDRLGVRQFLALPIALGGVAFVVLGGGARVHIAFGDILMLAGSFCWAIYNVLTGRMMPRGVDGFANTAAVMLTGGLALSAAAALAHARVAVPHAGAFISLMAMSLGGTVLSYLFWNSGIARLGAARTALFMNVVPVSSMAFSVLEGRAPTLTQIAGGAAVIGAVTLAAWPSGRSLVRRSAA